MEIIFLVLAMLVVGVLMGWIASLIWKDDLLESKIVYIISIATAVIVGLLDWYVIPAMGFSETMKWLGVAMEPALGALAVIWLIRRSRQ